MRETMANLIEEQYAALKGWRPQPVPSVSQPLSSIRFSSIRYRLAAGACLSITALLLSLSASSVCAEEEVNFDHGCTYFFPPLCPLLWPFGPRLKNRGFFLGGPWWPFEFPPFFLTLGRYAGPSPMACGNGSLTTSLPIRLSILRVRSNPAIRCPGAPPRNALVWHGAGLRFPKRRSESGSPRGITCRRAIRGYRDRHRR